MKRTIKVSLRNGTWYATHSDPKVASLFGTDTIATAYTAGASAEHVVKAIAALNPDCVVTFAQ